LALKGAALALDNALPWPEDLQMGHEFQSPLRRWDIVAGLCQSIDARTYVEVGCKEGRTVGFVLANCPNVTAIAIDPWREQPKQIFETKLVPIGVGNGTGAVEEVRKLPDDPTRETYADWDFAKIEAEFWANVGANQERCQQLRMTSHEAAIEWMARAQVMQTQPVKYAEVIFIDALHDYQSVKQDIADWWPLVRPGGYLCGHDFNHKWPGVERAVAEHFNLMDVGLAPDSVWFVRKPALAVAA
jgi:hypothetical protein